MTVKPLLELLDLMDAVGSEWVRKLRNSTHKAQIKKCPKCELSNYVKGSNPRPTGRGAKCANYGRCRGKNVGTVMYVLVITIWAITIWVTLCPARMLAQSCALCTLEPIMTMKGIPR